MDCLNLGVVYILVLLIVAVTERYFEGWGRILLAVAVLEKWPLQEGFRKSKCMERPPGRKMAASIEWWPL